MSKDAPPTPDQVISDKLDSIFNDYKKHAGWASLLSSNPDNNYDESTLKQAILQWVADEVVGGDYEFTVRAFPTEAEKRRLEDNNKILNNQRQILKDHGWKELEKL